MVGDGLQCPPSPLLFDPSVALDQSLRDVAEAPIDILALEEPSHPGLPPQTAPTDRGSSSAHVFCLAAEPPAELPAQVQPGARRGLPAVARLLLRVNRGPRGSEGFVFLGGEVPVCPPAHGLDDVGSVEGVAARACPQGSGGGRAVASSPWVARCHPLPVRGTGVTGAVWDAVGVSRRLGATRCGKPVFSHLGILRGAVIFWAKAACFLLLLSLIFSLVMCSSCVPPGACGLLRPCPQGVVFGGVLRRPVLHPLSPLRRCPCSASPLVGAECRGGGTPALEHAPPRP